MIATRCSLVLLLLLLLPGCAVHPLPEEVTGLDTRAIVDHIRCEARSAIQEKSIALLRESAGENAAGAARNNALADQLATNPDEFRKPQAIKLPTSDDRRFFDEYIESAIALDFTFDMTETNNVDTTIDLVKVLSGGTATLGLTTLNDRVRQNVRQFVVTNTFRELLSDPTLDCRGAALPPNLAYPVSGRVGVADVIDAFIDINEEKVLRPSTGKADSAVFADRLTFTTTVSVSATPKVVLTPAGHAIRLADAALTGTASRIDKHILAIGLSLKALKTPPSTSVRPRTILGISTARAHPRRSGAEEQAVEAVETLRLNQFLQNFSDVLPR